MTLFFVFFSFLVACWSLLLFLVYFGSGTLQNKMRTICYYNLISNHMYLCYNQLCTYNILVNIYILWWINTLLDFPQCKLILNDAHWCVFACVSVRVAVQCTQRQANKQYYLFSYLIVVGVVVALVVHSKVPLDINYIDGRISSIVVYCVR